MIPASLVGAASEDDTVPSDGQVANLLPRRFTRVADCSDLLGVSQGLRYHGAEGGEGDVGKGHFEFERMFQNCLMLAGDSWCVISRSELGGHRGHIYTFSLPRTQ